MLEKALATNTARRDVEYEHKDEANKQCMQALDEVDVADELLEDAHEHAVIIEDEVFMLESMDGEYEVMERLRDLSVAHAAQNEEANADTILHSAQEAAYKASMETLHAKRSLEQLEKYDQELRELLSQIRDEKLKLRQK